MSEAQLPIAVSGEADPGRLGVPVLHFDAARARSFDAWAADYDRFRPGYPDELFEVIRRELSLPAIPEVADVGAGTGRAALAMARLGWRVTAVEPGARMREALGAAATRQGLAVAGREGTAEATGLADGSVDLVTAAQAFHWFDPEPAVREMARVTRPGGGVALFWNGRDDEHSPFLAAFTELTRRYLPRHLVEEPSHRESPEVPDAFGGRPEFRLNDRMRLAHGVTWSPEHFVGYALTSSAVQKAIPKDLLATFSDDVLALAWEHATDGLVTIPLVLDVWLAARLG